jgi:hypothetical protein
MNGRKARAIRALARLKTTLHGVRYVGSRGKRPRSGVTNTHAPGTYRRIYRDIKRQEKSK